MSNETYEVIIIGGGPAGLTAGLYCSRAGLTSLLIEKGIFGGQITNAEHVENFPGFPQGISGMDLGEKMHEQASKHGLKTLFAEVTGLNINGELKTIKTTDGNFTGKTVILAGGAIRRKLGVEGEGKLTGRGVSYCAICDGAFFHDREVVVVGGGDTALTEALHLTNFASRITIIHRRNQLRADKTIQGKALAEPKIEFIWDTVVEAIEGNMSVSKLNLKQVKTGEKQSLEAAGVFVAIGSIPNTQYLQGTLPLDEAGYIYTNELMETEIAGVFAAGDIRHNSAKQVITAAGDGATAALSAEKFLEQLKV